jgi:hypothetical protein
MSGMAPDDRNQIFQALSNLPSQDFEGLLVSINMPRMNRAGASAKIIERHQAGEARVIPILLRPVDWQGALFNQLNVLPKNHQPVTTWPNPDEAFREIAAGIRAVAMEVRKANQ